MLAHIFMTIGQLSVYYLLSDVADSSNDAEMAYKCSQHLQGLVGGKGLITSVPSVIIDLDLIVLVQNSEITGNKTRQFCFLIPVHPSLHLHSVFLKCC